MGLFFPILIIGGALLLGASTKSAPAKSYDVPLPDGDFDYMDEDDGDLVLDEDGYTYEGSGYGDMPIAQMEAVQHYLQMLGYYQGEIHGRYTDATDSAIKQFQDFVNLPMTGEPDQTTLVALADVAENILEQLDTQAEEEEVSDDYIEKPLPNLFVYNGPLILLTENILPIAGVGKIAGSGHYPPHILVWDNSTALEEKVSRVLPVAAANPDIRFFVYQGEEESLDKPHDWADSFTVIDWYAEGYYNSGLGILRGPQTTDTSFWNEFDETLGWSVIDLQQRMQG